MSFMMKKKKYKFQVNFIVEELSSVPFVNAVLFVKIRLLDGGTFTEISSREEVIEHCVRWEAKFNFVCKMSANACTGLLDPCICRVSIRKELKGGRSFQKLGFADVNLSEFAGSGLTTRRYLLEGYDSKHRQDNSILKVTLEMVLLSGDPCFKVPTWKSHLLPRESQSQEEYLQPGERKAEDCSGGSITSGSSGVGSLPQLVISGAPGEGELPKDGQEEFEMGHSRNSSYNSQHSKASGYSSLHSRQSSSESGHNRNASSGSSFGDTGTMPKAPDRKRKQIPEEQKESRVDSTRVDADELINELIEATNLDADESSETSGLQLYIAKDGTAALGSHELKARMTAGVFEPVVINKR